MSDGQPPNDRGCRGCGKIGHLIRDCPKKKASDDNKKNRREQQQKKAIKRHDSKDLVEAIMQSKTVLDSHPPPLPPLPSQAPPEGKKLRQRKAKRLSNLVKDESLTKVVFYYETLSVDAAVSASVVSVSKKGGKPNKYRKFYKNQRYRKM